MDLEQFIVLIQFPLKFKPPFLHARRLRRYTATLFNKKTSELSEIIAVILDFNDLDRSILGEGLHLGTVYSCIMGLKMLSNRIIRRSETFRGNQKAKQLSKSITRLNH